MTGKMLAAALLGVTALSPLGHAQELQVGSNAYVDMLLTGTHGRGQTTGPVTEYTVFTKGDPMTPTTKGAILRYVDSYVYAMLGSGRFVAVRHSLGQTAGVLLYFRHRRVISAAGDSVPVSINIAVLVPANLAFTTQEHGDGPSGCIRNYRAHPQRLSTGRQARG